MYDYVVVGAGISGSIAARCFAEQGQKVLVVERRNHIAGNLYDETDESGILVQKYGPHIFHTNNLKVEEYLKKWGSWEDYFLECMVYMNGKYTPSPFNFQTIDDYFPKEKAEEIKSHIRQVYGNVPKETIVNMLECEDSVIREYAEFLYANDYSLYTAKQWGIEPSEIDKNVLRRVPVLFSYKTGYFDDTCQMMPTQGFTAVIKNILNHPNITVLLNTDANHSLSFSEETKKVYYEGNEITVIYTGAVDELLDYRYGRLPYRSLRRILISRLLWLPILRQKVTLVSPSIKSCRSKRKRVKPLLPWNIRYRQMRSWNASLITRYLRRKRLRCMDSTGNIWRIIRICIF